MFLEGVADLFLVIHKFLLLVLKKDPPVDAENEGRRIKLTVVVVLRVSVFWR